MDRSLLIEKIANWLDDAEHGSKIEFAKQIYKKYPNSLEEKGSGTQFILKNIPTEFLLELCEKNKSSVAEMEFWEKM